MSYPVSQNLHTLLRLYSVTAVGKDNDLAGLIADAMEEETGGVRAGPWWDALLRYMRHTFTSRAAGERPGFPSFIFF